MGIAALILGILTLLMAFIPPLCIIAIVTGVSGIITGIFAAKNKKEQKNIGIAGIITSGIGFAIAVIMTIVFATYYLAGKHLQEKSYARDNKKISTPPPPSLRTFELKSFAKTTSDPQPHFVRLKISLAYATNAQLKKELTDRRKQIRHIINLILQGKKYEELKDTAGQIMLGEKIRGNVNKILVSGTIKEIYFLDFMIN